MYIFKTNTERFQLNANYANALREADGGLYTFGNVNKPVYFNNGVPVVCNQYGGGTAITLNGTSKASSTASFYAPTSAGTNGQILSSTGGAPGWINQSAITAGTAAKWATARTLTLTGDVTGSVSFDGSGNISLTTTVGNDSHSHSNYLPLSGGTMTGNINRAAYKGGAWINGRDNAAIRTSSSVSSSSFAPIVSAKTQLGSWDLGPCHPNENFYFSYATDANYNAGTNSTNSAVYIKNNGVLMGAAWNDYAEYRTQSEEIEPGYCVASADNGQVYKTNEKFQACDGIVSDTFGFAIGETDKCKTPLAVAGRVLAYCEGDRYSYHSGDTVCAGPDGKVCKMTREEIKEWPDRVIGIVSEIPDYEIWGTGNIKVNGRIWIRIK